MAQIDDKLYLSGGYVDELMSRKTFNELFELPTEAKFTGLTVTVQNLIGKTPGDFWLVGGKTNFCWRLKSIPTLDSEETLDTLKNICVYNGKTLIPFGFEASISDGTKYIYLPSEEGGHWVNKQEVDDELLSNAVDTAVEGAVDKIISGASQSFDTLKEVEEWIQAHSAFTADFGDKNVIEVVKVNGEEVEVTDKTVDIAVPSIEGLATKEEVAAAETELKDAIAVAVEDLKIGDYATKEALEAEVERAIAEENKAVKWVESENGRMHIVLPSHFSILGEGANCEEGQPNGYEGGENLDGSTFNLVMFSKWNVADFGSSKVKLNLNSKDGKVFINDNEVVATVKDVENAVSEHVTEYADKIGAIETMVKEIPVADFATKEELEAEVARSLAEDKTAVKWVESQNGRMHIVLPAHFSMLGTGSNCEEGQPNGYEGGENLAGSTYNLVMLSKWNVADFGSASLKLNLNAKDGKVYINDSEVVATLTDIQEATKNLATKEEVAAVDNVIESISVNGEQLEVSGKNVDIHISGLTEQDVVDIIAKTLIPEDAKEAFDTLEEISAWIQSHPDDAATMNQNTLTLSGKVETLQTQLSDLESYLYWETDEEEE